MASSPDFRPFCLTPSKQSIELPQIGVSANFFAGEALVSAMFDAGGLKSLLNGTNCKLSSCKLSPKISCILISDFNRYARDCLLPGITPARRSEAAGNDRLNSPGRPR